MQLVIRNAQIMKANSVQFILLRHQANGYEPIVLTAGDNDVGGRFGSAIASAGDLNSDGYNDIIVGAPYLDDNSGAVYVFHGTDTGIDTQIKQVKLYANTI